MWQVPRLWLIMLALLIAPMTASAQGVNPETQPSAQIRFVHGITNIQAVDIYLDGELIVNNLSFRNATDYGLTGTGTKLISVLASTTDGSIGQSLLDKSLELNTGHSYTLAVSGNDIQVDASLFEDDTGASNESQGSLRVVNLAQQSGIAAAINEAAFTSLIHYGTSSNRKLIDKSNVSPTVSVLDKTGQVLLSTEPIFLGNGEFYTLFVLNSGNGLQYASINYPLTSGELPTTSIWIPVASFDWGEEPAGEEPAEGEHGAEGEEPAEGEHGAEGEEPAEGEHGAEGEQPAEGEHGAEGETLEALLPVPLWMLIGCSLLVVLLLLGGSWLWWVAFHRNKK